MALGEDRITRALRSESQHGVSRHTVGHQKHADLPFHKNEQDPNEVTRTQSPDEQDLQGDGSAESGYVTPDLGPFECSNCVNFDGQSACSHPTVQADPEVQGQVSPEGCCNFFASAHRENQAQEHSEGAGNPQDLQSLGDFEQ